MSSKSSFKPIGSAVALAMLSIGGLAAGVPDWLRAAAATPAGSYESGVAAVVLLDETITNVKDNGEITTLHRRAYRILNPQGRSYGALAVAFDKNTRISGVAGWSISAQGRDLELKSKDAIETNYSVENLYDDTRRLVLGIPGDPGNVIGYEYEQKQRPWMLQDIHWFQDQIP